MPVTSTNPRGIAPNAPSVGTAPVTAQNPRGIGSATGAPGLTAVTAQNPRGIGAVSGAPSLYSQAPAQAPATASAMPSGGGGPLSAVRDAVNGALAGAGSSIAAAGQSPQVQQGIADWRAANTAPPIGTMLQQPAALNQQFKQSGAQVQNQTQGQAQSLFNAAQAGGITSQNVAAPGYTPEQQAYVNQGQQVQAQIQQQLASGAITPQQANQQMSAWSQANPPPARTAAQGMLGAPGGSTYVSGQPGSTAPGAGGQIGLTPTGNAGGGAAPGVQTIPGSFQVGQRLPTGPAPTAPGNVAGSSLLGGVRDVVNAPSVAGQLGGAPQVGNVGGIAGQLGAAPQVGNVGNVSTGSAPGAVTPQLGNFGQTNANQQSMLGRVNSFLDAPQGPSIAEAQLRQSQADNMGALIGAARSGRGGAGSTAQALRSAQSEGSAIMSDTAGQLATLRAQEEDMRKNRDLSAIGLGGNLATAQRQQDLGFRGQDLASLQGDQSTALGARGQDLTASLANQQTQTALEGLRAQTALGARGQDLSALQGDQGTALGLEGLRASTALGARGQNLSALGMDAGNQLAAQQLGVQRDLGARGQNLQALQGDQSTGLGMAGLGVQRELGLRGQDVTTRAQDLSALTSDADRNLAAQGLGVQRELGLTNAGLTAQGQGLNYLANTNQQQNQAQALTNDLYNTFGNQSVALNGQQINYEIGKMNADAQPNFGEQLAGNLLNIGGPILANALLPGSGTAMQLSQAGGGPQTGITVPGQVKYDSNGYPISDERAKTDITPLESVKRAAASPIAQLHRDAKGYQYRYKPGVGEDTETVHWGPMAQDLARSKVGKSLVKTLPSGLKVVDANRLTMTNHAAISEMRSELDGLRKLLRVA